MCRRPALYLPFPPDVHYGSRRALPLSVLLTPVAPQATPSAIHLSLTPGKFWNSLPASIYPTSYAFIQEEGFKTFIPEFWIILWMVKGTGMLVSFLFSLFFVSFPLL